MNKEKILNMFGIYREAHPLTLGYKKVTYSFNFLNLDFTVSRVESTIQ
jgi:hypothetical protein